MTGWQMSDPSVNGVRSSRHARICLRVCVFVLAAELIGLPASAQQGNPDAVPARSQKAKSQDPAAFIVDVCKRIETSARMWTLPPAFFARLIWKESRFNPNAVSPKGASGIAQFMPGTAKLRGLEDPFDPRSALPASAHYLSDMRNKFGNLGLAAAAYNAGPGRVRDWRDGRSFLPAETQDFVVSITGFSAREWNSAKRPKADYALDKKLSFLEACRKLPIRRFKARQHYAMAPRQPWGVQLAADWSPTRALAHYSRIQKRFPKVLGGLTPMVLRVVNYNMGRAPRFEVRIGRPSRGKANAFCSRLRKAGGVCVVFKTGS